MGPQQIVLKIPWCFFTFIQVWMIYITPGIQCTGCTSRDMIMEGFKAGVHYQPSFQVAVWLIIQSKPFFSRNNGHSKKMNLHQLLPKPHRSEIQLLYVHAHTPTYTLSLSSAHCSFYIFQRTWLFQSVAATVSHCQWASHYFLQQEGSCYKYPSIYCNLKHICHNNMRNSV